MTSLQQLIQMFDTEQNADVRAGMITRQFGNISDTAKWPFLLQLIQQQDTYYLVKINIYKLIELAACPEAERVTIKDVVLAAIDTEENELVRQYAFISLSRNFNEFDDVLQRCVAAMENEQEDLDVRYCAWDVIARSGNKDRVEALRDRLLEIQSFGTSVERFFAVPGNA